MNTMKAVDALADHLGYGHKLDNSTKGDPPVLVLSEHQCAQLLYELTDDKCWLEGGE